MVFCCLIFKTSIRTTTVVMLRTGLSGKHRGVLHLPDQSEYLVCCCHMQVVHVDVYVADRFTGWRERALVNLSQLYDHDTHSFPANVSEQMVAQVSMFSQMVSQLSIVSLSQRL